MIRINQAHFQVSARTDAGMTGKNNEDRYAVSAFQVSEVDATQAVLAVVADGIGGHRAGEVAAEMAVEHISQYIASSDAAHPVEILRGAFQMASQAIFAASQEGQGFQGMGTTCACVWVIGEKLYAVWVGDSRIYLLRNQTIQRLSIDHTFVQEALDQGVLTPKEARNTPVRHVIHRYLGAATPVEPDFRLRLHPGENDAQAESNQGLIIHPGDRIVLCSDGLTDLVEETEMLPRLLESSLEVGVNQLVDLANQRGGLDNITIVVLEAPEPSRAISTSEPGATPKPTRRKHLGCASVAGLAFLAVLAVLWWNTKQTEPTLTPTPGLAPSATQLVPAAIQTLPATPSLNATTAALEPTPVATTSPIPAETLTPWATHTHSP